MPDTATVPPKPPAKTETKSGPPTERWRVRASHPRDNKRVLFSTVSETRARKFMVNRFPRGSEAYLEAPDGSTESYENERAGPYGEDAEQWASFDPEAYIPPEEQPPPGESAWADVEA
jgi:hypothetical protein